jgi:3-dehydrosphinganine reductase
MVLDITQQEAAAQVLSEFCAHSGAPDLVFNCAGLAHPGYLDEQSADKLREMMEVNYFGTMTVCRTLLPHFKERGSGVFVNTSSLGGLMGLFGYTGYCASKYAVVGFSEALRREVKPFHLQVTLLCPPNTKTPGLARENLTKPAEVLAQEKNVREVEPEFVADKLLKALPRNPSLVIPTLDGWLAYYLSRFAPSILDRFLRRPQ